MRKKERQQGKSEQLRLFKSVEITYRPEIERSSGTTELQGESIHFSLLARNRALTEGILERIVSPSNLKKAYEQVRKNKGSSGVDRMNIKDLSEWLGANMENYQVSIIEESYKPALVLGVKIPKPNGGSRQLGIPTIKDRLLQQAIHQVLQEYYDPLFSVSSYGFRPNRSALDAVKQSSEYIKLGYEWVVDIDLKSYFDTINHDRLMQRLSKGIGDKRLLRLIRKFLRAGLLQDGLTQQRTSGTPQGGPLSPLLSNIVLDELDKELESRGHLLVRYADDCNIYVKSKRAGERVLASMTKFIEGKLKLTINEEKSGVRHCSKVKFLGYTIMSEGKIRVADKSITRFKDKVREVTKRNRGVSFSQIIKDLNQITRGWMNYFQLAESWLPWRSLDGWIRRKLRCYRLKQCGRKYTIYKFLRRLGVSNHKAWNVVLYGGQWWAMSNRQTCTKAMNERWFAEQGMYMLTDLYKSLKC